MIGAMSSSAADYAGLVFTDQSGQTTSVALDGLRITFDGDKAVVVNNAGSVELQLWSLASMQFTTTLAAVDVAVDGAAVEVFTTTGVSVGAFSCASDAQAMLAPGIYIVKSAHGVTKIAIQ